LKSNFYKYNNWEFVKEIGNFDLDNRSEIVPIEIADTSMTFRCDGQYITVGYLDDGEKFWIVSKYPIDEERPRLSETEMSKTFNKK